MPWVYANAQSVEAEWRVTNTESPTVVPAYAGQANPFPTITEQVVVVAPTPEVSEADLKNREKADILQQARNIINGNQAFVANLDNIQFDGYMEGLRGKKVLMKGSWIGIGQTINVPVKGAKNAYAMLEKLQALDVSLANQVKAELDAKLIKKAVTDIKVVDITKEKVTLVEGSQRYEVRIKPSTL
ncbi:MAG: hypothetical protein WAZ18_00275 [Alphaproteobacteria bacterium]